MLKRKIYDELIHWKAGHTKEGLLIKGARQIGKTFIIDEFGKRNYSSYLYLNFVTNPEYREIFASSLEAKDIFAKLSIRFQSFRVIPGNTLIFLDEIQNCPFARTAIKPLAIDGKVDVIASGSLLGLTFLDDTKELKKERQEASIPVGYERQITMHPLDFEEYLWALGYREETIDILRTSFNTLTPLPRSSNERMLKLFREYLAIGGMPEVVNQFIAQSSFSAAFDEQQKIIASNLDDIVKYAPSADKPKIRACYLSLPEHLARENKKFKYATVEHGGTARKFGSSVDWLRESSLVLKCHNLETAEIPTNAYRMPDCFKLYVSDIGILSAMMGFEIKQPLVDDKLKGFAKGGIYENAIMTQLVARGYSPSYYLPQPNKSEIDFLIEQDGTVVPVEVKAGNNASTSFDRMLQRDDIQLGYKFVNGNIGRFGKKVTLPHYMSMFI